jgi:hypothetical protein
MLTRKCLSEKRNAKTKSANRNASQQAADHPGCMETLYEAECSAAMRHHEKKRWLCGSKMLLIRLAMRGPKFESKCEPKRTSTRNPATPLVDGKNAPKKTPPNADPTGILGSWQAKKSTAPGHAAR